MRLLMRCLLLTLLISWPVAAAAAQHQHVALSDAQIKQQVEHKLSQLDLGTYRPSVAVAGHVVTISGTVPSAWFKKEIIERARKVDGVQSVVAELTVPAAESDEALAAQVSERLRRYVFYSVFDDVEGSVENGVVTLTGKVTAPFKASDIADAVSRVTGVREVQNDIHALPTSMFDDELRWSIARRIYRDPMFSNYAIQANPPLHVVVENSRVTLTGVVNSEVERRMAESIARSTFGVLGVENKLKLDREVTTR